MIYATLNGTDITKWIDKESFKVNAEQLYEEWQNANFVSVRIPIRKRVSGKFNIRCGNRSQYSDFLTLLSAATVNGVTTMGVYVQNENQFEAISAYITLNGSEFYEADSGTHYNLVEVDIMER